MSSIIMFCTLLQIVAEDTPSVRDFNALEQNL